MSDQQTSYFQKMRSPQKGRGWGVFDVLLMSTKSMCVFYHQWCIDQRNLHEIQPHLSRQQQIQLFITNPSPTKHCAEPCFSMFLFSFCVQNPVSYVSILSFLCRALWCDQTKGPSDLVPQSDVLKLLPLSQVGWFVICFGFGLLIICCHSFKLVFSSKLANPLFVVEFSQTYKAVVHGVV